MRSKYAHHDRTWQGNRIIVTRDERVNVIRESAKFSEFHRLNRIRYLKVSHILRATGILIVSGTLTQNRSMRHFSYISVESVGIGITSSLPMHILHRDATICIDCEMYHFLMVSLNENFCRAGCFLEKKSVRSRVYDYFQQLKRKDVNMQGCCVSWNMRELWNRYKTRPLLLFIIVQEPRCKSCGLA